jgi:hypothetical protein
LSRPVRRGIAFSLIAFGIRAHKTNLTITRSVWPKRPFEWVLHNPNGLRAANHPPLSLGVDLYRNNALAWFTHPTAFNQLEFKVRGSHLAF